MVLKRYSRPVEVVVYAQETPFVQLRATLRKRGLQPLPSLPRRDDGPALYRDVLADDAPVDPAVHSGEGGALPDEDLDLAGLGLDELGLGDLDDDEGEATPASPSPNFPGLAGAPPPPGFGGGPSSPPRFSLPSSKAAAPTFGGGLAAGSRVEDDPPTAQIRADKVGALIEKSRSEDSAPQGQPQQMTSRASTHTEMVDLSPWGYSLQVMFLGTNNATPAGDVLRGLQTHLGPWLQSIVEDPPRLAEDPNYSRMIEQQIIEHLSEVMGAYPAVSADLNYLMG